jgi:putative flippase GtrA
MQSVRALLRHPFAGPLVRYGIAGATVAVVYLAVPLALNGFIGIALEVAILIGYVLAVTLHFNLQRHFVFRHVDEFALSVRQQIGRYVVIGAIQYPITAVATAVLPGLLDISERLTFVMVTVVMSVTFFLLLRGHVFHPEAEEEILAERDGRAADRSSGRPRQDGQSTAERV